ncbi:MAG: AI-2E family transporter [Nitrosomonadales bacterium]|nr:AI-2E family transporter [Nitrosomonadales bacterium]
MRLRYFRRGKEPAHITLLRDVPLFSDLSTHELHTLDDLLHQRDYVQNEIIFDQDEEGQALYFVLSGKVIISQQGSSEILAEVGPGQFFGERALLENMPRIAQARASEDCVLAVLFRADFLWLLHTHPVIAKKISEHCSLRDATRKIEASQHTGPGVTNLRDVPGPIAWIGILTVTCLMLFVFKKILWLVVPFLLALILYYMLLPLAKKMILAGFSSTFAAISLSGLFLLGITLAVLSFYPLAIANADEWQAGLAHYLAGGAALLESLLQTLRSQFSFLQNANFDDDIYMQFRDFSMHFSDKYLGEFMLSLAAWLPSLLLTPLITFFLLKDNARLRKMIGGAVPNAFFEKTLYLMHAVDRTARIYFVGLMKITVLDTFIMASGLWLLGLNSPILLGLMVAVLNWIPYLGPILGFAIVMMVVATDFPGNLPLVYSIIALFIALRALDDLIFLPLIVGKSLHIHPLLTLMMFLVGEAIAGVAGLMLVIPILGIVMVLGETLEIILTDMRLQARHIYSRNMRWIAANRDLTQKDTS